MIYRCYFHLFFGRLETAGEKNAPYFSSLWQNNIHNIALGVFTCWIMSYRNEIITHTWQSFPHTIVCLSMNWWMCSRLPAGTVINWLHGELDFSRFYLFFSKCVCADSESVHEPHKQRGHQTEPRTIGVADNLQMNSAVWFLAGFREIINQKWLLKSRVKFHLFRVLNGFRR